MIVDFKAKLLVKPGMVPKFCKPQTLPFDIKGTIEGELNRIEAAGIVERVMTHTDWAAPIVAVPKKDGGFRIYGDYMVTVNGALDVDDYLLQTPVNCLLHLLVARNLLNLTNRRLISNFCWIRSQPSMFQLILIKDYIDITDFLLI